MPATHRRRRARGAELYAKRSNASAPAMPRPSTGHVIAQAVDNDPSWTATKVRAALDEHEEGQFFESSKLIDAMGRDDRITGCLNVRRSGLLGSDFDIAPGESGSDRYVDGVKSWWYASAPTPVQGKLLTTLVMAGLAIARVPYKTNSKTWDPGLIRNWPLQSVWADPDTGAYKTSTQNQGTVDIHIDDPNWLVLEADPDRPWMCGAVRALGLLFAMRQFNWSDWAKYNERHGSPIIKVFEPPVKDNANKKTFFDSVRRMGSRGAVRMPQPIDKDSNGYDVQLLEAKANTYETFKAFRSDIDTSIAIVLLGQNLTTEVKGGSLAAASIHMDIRQDIKEGDAAVLSTGFKEQVVTPYCALNHAGFEPDDAPTPQYDIAEEEDQAEAAEVHGKTADNLAKFRKLGLPVDEARVLEEAGVPLVEGAKLPKPDERTAPDDEADAQDDDEGTDDDSDEGDGDAQARAPRVASGITAKSDGFIDSQLYADDLADDQRVAVAGHLRGGLAERLLEALDADSYDEMRERVLAAYEGEKPPHAIMARLTKAFVLAHRAGEVGTQQDA